MDYALRIVVEKVAIRSQEVIKRDTITSYALQCPTSMVELGRAGLLGRRGRRRWHGDCARPLGQGHGLLAPRGVDSVERPAMRREHLGEDLGEIVYHMKPVCHLGGSRGTVPGSLRIGLRAVACRVRANRLWIRRAGRAHSGQDTLVCVARTSRVICAAVWSM